MEVLSEIATAHLFALVAFMVFAAVVQGTLGFGFAIVSVPFLVLMDERLAPVPQLIASTFFSARIWWREREATDLPGVLVMSLGRLPGTYLGYLLLLVGSVTTLDLTIGSLVLLAVLVIAFGQPVPRNRVTQALAGVGSGIGAYVSAIAGPPVALLYKGAKGPEVRANISLFFVIGNGITLLGRGLGGAFTELDLWLGIVSVPAGLFGVWLSGRIKDRIEGRPLQVGILLLCSLAALALFGRAAEVIPRAAPPPVAADAPLIPLE